MCAVRLEWTFAEFFADGGSTTFADRLAAVIGVHASQIKMVSVYEGSLVLDYEITASPTTTDSAAELQAIQTKQIDLIANNKINFGAPLLDSSISGANIVSNGVVVAPNYTPIVITQTATNTQTSTSGTTSTTTSSTSTTTSTSTSTSTTSNVKTNTKKEFQENKPDVSNNGDYFTKIDFVNEHTA
jgi:hypothetical protein